MKKMTEMSPKDAVTSRNKLEKLTATKAATINYESFQDGLGLGSR